jgi:polyhydroxyalkanoate synthase
MQEMANKGQEMFAEFLKMTANPVAQNLDPLNVGDSLKQASRNLWLDPNQLMQANLNLWQQHMQLWQNASTRLMGGESTPVAEPEKGDRRFRHEDWEQNPLFDFIKQSYLITTRWMIDTLSNIEGMDKQSAQKVEFWTRQLADAFSPSNFVWTNPEVLRATLETKGENLVKGLENFRRDLEAGDGTLQMTTSKSDAFEIGENIATAPGKVIWQNDLVQLIQYAPTTDEVYETPLVIIPPWINKFYILDLTAEKSFIRWAVDRGYTVFVVSWVNPDEQLAEKTFEDYLREGILEVVETVKKATGAKNVSTIGYCIGGTLLAAALAHLAATDDHSVKAATFFAAQVDFSEAGDLKVFIDEKQLENLDSKMAEKGYLEGQSMFTTFNMLRANDLIWSFYVNNYLLGKEPMPFDLLYWNSDVTRLPRNTHMYYLREMYLHNNLVKPGMLELCGTPIDLTKIDIPVYLQASREDHIAPYHSVFKAVGHYTGPVRAILAGSGHIAGVINPPTANKYKYWTNDELPYEPDKWLANAEEHPGSWWPDWDRWLSKLSGKKVTARTPGADPYPALEDAPGSYVRIRADS